MQTILVTGGAGFIGSNFVRYMLETHGDMRIVNVGAGVYDILEATGFTGMCDVEMKA